MILFAVKAADSDLHPGVAISAAEWCADDRKLPLNVLATAIDE